MAKWHELRQRLVVTTLAATIGLCAGSASVFANESDDKPSSKSEKSPFEQRQNVVYGEVDGVGLLMDVFTPTGAKNGIGIVDIASGAWYSDRGKIRDHQRGKFFDVFCGRGYTVFAIRPGSRSKFSAPEMVANVRKGIHWVQEHAADYGIDPNRLALTGASAGGHLACLTIVTTPHNGDGKVDQPIAAVAVFFPPTDFLEWGGRPIDYSKDDRFGFMVRGLAVTHKDGKNAEPDKADLTDLVRKISPARLVDGKQPPFLIIHGDADPLVPLQQSQVFVEALKKAGGSAELIVKPKGGHPWPTISEEVKVMADWFDKQLQRKQAS